MIRVYAKPKSLTWRAERRAFLLAFVLEFVHFLSRERVSPDCRCEQNGVDPYCTPKWGSWVMPMQTFHADSHTRNGCREQRQWDRPVKRVAAQVCSRVEHLDLPAKWLFTINLVEQPSVDALLEYRVVSPCADGASELEQPKNPDKCRDERRGDRECDVLECRRARAGSRSEGRNRCDGCEAELNRMLGLLDRFQGLIAEGLVLLDRNVHPLHEQIQSRLVAGDRQPLTDSRPRPDHLTPERRRQLRTSRWRIIVAVDTWTDAERAMCV